MISDYGMDCIGKIILGKSITTNRDSVAVYVGDGLRDCQFASGKSCQWIEMELYQNNTFY